jgi:hypothetical protein
MEGLMSDKRFIFNSSENIYHGYTFWLQKRHITLAGQEFVEVDFTEYKDIPTALNESKDLVEVDETFIEEFTKKSEEVILKNPNSGNGEKTGENEDNNLEENNIKTDENIIDESILNSEIILSETDLSIPEIINDENIKQDDIKTEESSEKIEIKTEEKKDTGKETSQEKNGKKAVKAGNK